MLRLLVILLALVAPTVAERVVAARAPADAGRVAAPSGAERHAAPVAGRLTVPPAPAGRVAASSRATRRTAPPAGRVAASSGAPRRTAPPAPDAALPRSPRGLADAFAATTRALRASDWDGSGAVPEEFTLLALYHQRILRLLSRERSLGDRTLRAMPRDVRGEARDTVDARRALAAIPRGKPPRVRTAPAAPASELRAAYREGQRRFGVHWSVLAAVNFVESAFGRVRSASEAGARGPMQFLPATWREYGLGGDIEDPRDAILGAANYLHRSGAEHHLDRALYAYNHSADYVRAIKRFAARMRTDERALKTFYAWQVYVGSRRLTGPRGG